ncbi:MULTISPECIES: IS701 family transposase [Kitasatospora]|uniref:IS701 family transposase n=1 Tax=Kitasatospora cystarginea TaxID=58350 RepID=A0ABP5RQ22_9ACTN
MLQVRPAKAAEAPDGFSTYCKELFALLGRADQRRWGEVYLSGLLHASGRRTPRNIAEHVLGRPATQPIQQFVNQSTWDPTELRRYLAERLCAATQPQAWAFDEVVFRKNGTRSVGVARQFVPAEGRMVNCQLALAASLVSQEASLPVNWRLLMPRHWDADEDLRTQARVPDEERHRPRWHYLLDSVDEMLQDWDLPPAPVLADWSFEPEVEPLLLGLEQRGLGYLVEVGATTQLPGRPVHSYPSTERSTSARRWTAAAVARDPALRTDRSVAVWRDRPDSRYQHSQFMLVPLTTGATGRSPAPRQLVVEWPFGRPQPRTYLVTNLCGDRLNELVALAELRHQSSRCCEQLHQDYGLGDFEGRSFPGWHHHVTLVSAARGFHALQQLARPGEPDRPVSLG